MIASLVRIATVLALLCVGSELTGCLPRTVAHGSKPVAMAESPVPIPTLPPLDTILPSI